MTENREYWINSASNSVVQQDTKVHIDRWRIGASEKYRAQIFQNLTVPE